jgi:hypothetical protein
VPVEFLTDVQAEAYGRFVGLPSRMELERFCFLDDVDLRLVGRRRGDHNRLGYGVQLATVRYLGAFLADPVDVPGEVGDCIAAQLDVVVSCLAVYAEREKTRLEHQWEIAREFGYREFVEVEGELARWVDDRAWTTGEGPNTIFTDAIRWLRERRVLLPGVTTLARIVARERDAATLRVWTELAQAASAGQARRLSCLLDVPDGARQSELDRIRKAETVTSGVGMVRALSRVSEIAGLGLGGVDLSVVPQRRVVALARYGMAATATALRRHPEPRRLATLVATVRSLEASAVDDALELFDVLMTNDLLARAARESRKEKLRRYPRLSRDAGRLAAAVGVLLDALDREEQLPLEVIWEEIESKVSREDLRSAVAHLTEVAQPPDADADGEWRAALVDRYASVRAFVPMLRETIEFGATADAAGVLSALRDLPRLLAARVSRAVPAGYFDARQVAVDVVPAGWWRRLVFKPDRPEGTVDRAAYVFCVLEQFHRHLIRRDIYATPSTRYGDPRAKLLTGRAWDAAKGPALNALSLPEDPGELHLEHSAALDGAWRGMAQSLTGGTVANVGSDGRLHAEKIDAIPDPPSLVDLRRRLEAMLPRVDLPELILEVMGWLPAFAGAFTGISGGQSRMNDLGDDRRRADRTR